MPEANYLAGDYVRSGRFQEELEDHFGPLHLREPDGEVSSDEVSDDEDGDAHQIALLPDDLALEVHALFTLFARYDFPKLCRFAPGSFWSSPAEYDLDAEGVREEEWFHDDDDIDVVMNSIEIFRQSGSPSLLIGKYGAVLFNEDPHSFVILARGLEPLLRSLILLESAALGEIDAQVADDFVRQALSETPRSRSRRVPSRAQAPEAAHDHRWLPFVKRALEQARSHPQP